MSISIKIFVRFLFLVVLNVMFAPLFSIGVFPLGKGGQTPCTFTLRITWGEGVYIACKNAYVIIGRPLVVH